MKTKLFALFISISVFGSATAKSCDCSQALARSEHPAPAQAHPLRGVIVDVLAEKNALVVKHEDIPGYMPAMTMVFKVDAATLKSVAKGQTITATLTKEDGEFWLREVKPAAPSST